MESTEFSFRLAMILLPIFGFFIAGYIYTHKKKEKTLVCPINFNCEAVVHSTYSKFLGIPVEILGMLYYLGVAGLYAFFLITPRAHPTLELAALAITTSAFLFSIYLTSVQIFSIKEFCTWCLLSATISTLMFIFALQTSAESLALLTQFFSF